MKKILEPRLKDELIICSDVNDLLARADIYDYEINNCLIDIEDDGQFRFEGCYFKKVKFINHKNIKIEFINCIFEDCDFSNFEMANSIINQVNFNNCKLYGIDLSTSNIHDTIFLNTNLSFGNFTDCRIDYCLFNNCYMQNSFFNNVKFKEIIFKSSDLCFSEFAHTSLKNINLSDSKISGIKVNINDLQGLIVNEFQALELSSLLGIKIDR